MRPETQAAVHALALAGDGRPRPTGASGYVAEIHPMLAGVVVVWAPCGCQSVLNTAGNSLLTACLTPECAFDWSEALNALKLLESVRQDSIGFEIVRAAPAEVSSETKVSEVPQAADDQLRPVS